MPEKSPFAKYLAGFLALAAVAYAYAVTFAPMPDTGAEYADFILGTLVGSILTAIVGFYFGNSDNNNNPPTNPTL